MPFKGNPLNFLLINKVHWELITLIKLDYTIEIKETKLLVAFIAVCSFWKTKYKRK